jgi:hypothetical protein
MLIDVVSQSDHGTVVALNDPDAPMVPAGLSPTTRVPLNWKVPVVRPCSTALILTTPEDAESLSKMMVPFSRVESRRT